MSALLAIATQMSGYEYAVVILAASAGISLLIWVCDR